MKLARHPVILPGQTLGVVGSGQLGRMLTLAAKAMGYRVHVYSPDDAASPAGQVCDRVFTGTYDDVSGLQAFSQTVDVITFEFENISAQALSALGSGTPIHPRPEVLHIAQNRLREKTFLEQHGFPVVPFVPVHSLADLQQAVEQLGLPSVLKTAGFGYDGKGQSRLARPEDLEPAYAALNGQLAVLEQWADFAAELSVLVARNTAGETACFDPVENRHVNHILDVSIVPGQFNRDTLESARNIALSIAEALDLVGVLAVEFFLLSSGRLVVNELAPRPHNSGHWTIEAAACSQFEQQLRAVCGLPLGGATLRQPVAMANLLGDLWQDDEPNWTAVLAHPEVHLHLYGKAQPRPGRKMGHLTALADTPEAALARVLKAREQLTAQAVNSPA